MRRKHRLQTTVVASARALYDEAGKRGWTVLFTSPCVSRRCQSFFMLVHGSVNGSDLAALHAGAPGVAGVVSALFVTVALRAGQAAAVRALWARRAIQASAGPYARAERHRGRSLSGVSASPRVRSRHSRDARSGEEQTEDMGSCHG